VGLKSSNVQKRFTTENRDSTDEGFTEGTEGKLCSEPANESQLHPS
jgi:hypothetical protein